VNSDGYQQGKNQQDSQPEKAGWVTKQQVKGTKQHGSVSRPNRSGVRLQKQIPPKLKAK
jgi:hypothetical protein